MSPISIEINEDGEAIRVDKKPVRQDKDKCFNTFPCKHLTITDGRCYCELSHGAVYFLDECPEGYWYIPERVDHAKKVRHISWYETNKRKHQEESNGKNHLARHGNDRTELD